LKRTLFGLTINGIKICPEKSMLIPCLHEENFAYLDCIKKTFQSARKILFNSPPEMEFACSYNVTKDLLMMGRVRPGFFWERVILQAFGERSWYQFLKREAQTDWYNFVAKNKVRLTEEELSEIQKIFLRYSENGSLPRDLEPILIPKIKESPIFRKAEAILRTYLLTLSSDDSGEMTEFLDYIPRFVTEYFSFFEAAHYVTAFSSLRGTDLVVLSWADTLTRYVLEARLDPFVEFEFMRIAGIKK